VGVEVGAVLTLAVDRQVIAVENRVEAFVPAAAAARRAELADRAARPVRAVDREDVGAELDSAGAAGRSDRRANEGQEEPDK
jgi:hypothetical protein